MTSNRNPNKGRANQSSRSDSSRHGPSVASLAALGTLAVSLWLDVELSASLFRSVMVYLGVSLLALFYRVILGHYLNLSQERAQQEFLKRMQQEAEEEAAQAKKEAAAASRSAASAGQAASGKPVMADPKTPKVAEAVKT